MRVKRDKRSSSSGSHQGLARAALADNANGTRGFESFCKTRHGQRLRRQRLAQQRNDRRCDRVIGDLQWRIHLHDSRAERRRIRSEIVVIGFQYRSSRYRGQRKKTGVGAGLRWIVCNALLSSGTYQGLKRAAGNSMQRQDCDNVKADRTAGSADAFDCGCAPVSCLQYSPVLLS